MCSPSSREALRSERSYLRSSLTDYRDIIIDGLTKAVTEAAVTA